MKNKSQSLADQVIAGLGTTDESNVRAFYARQREELVYSIEINEQNISVAKLKSTGLLKELDRKLQDAKKAVTRSYLAVRPEKIATNDDQDAFSKTYWEGVAAAERKVSELEADIKKANDDIAAKIAAFEEQVELLNGRIAIIDGGIA